MMCVIMTLMIHSSLSKLDAFPKARSVAISGVVIKTPGSESKY